ncbi:hypothetical protein H4R33_000180 [Dimargaris cristalligena]|uniref:Uncharacterized protein n=1 Tax=Dimargaris cristalligena TaxID=215637 RepID=A0A4Q0A2E0_9FUNG|nr:hypothetical protein H4R33_000180 [Dimargaris cristalligena]RKP40227.1 hypothetical protein BJ085DRAFT_37437 [Dimargaris cristalligena]|eukprot:RKP40227.1 hypothetical protein BJ085DRAFT_37437 [Dimargaris cristalligena]
MPTKTVIFVNPVVGFSPESKLFNKYEAPYVDFRTTDDTSDRAALTDVVLDLDPQQYHRSFFIIFDHPEYCRTIGVQSPSDPKPMPLPSTAEWASSAAMQPILQSYASQFMIDDHSELPSFEGELWCKYGSRTGIKSVHSNYPLRLTTLLWDPQYRFFCERPHHFLFFRSTPAHCLRNIPGFVTNVMDNNLGQQLRSIMYVTGTFELDAMCRIFESYPYSLHEFFVMHPGNDDHGTFYFQSYDDEEAVDGTRRYASMNVTYRGLAAILPAVEVSRMDIASYGDVDCGDFVHDFDPLW